MYIEMLVRGNILLRFRLAQKAASKQSPDGAFLLFLPPLDGQSPLPDVDSKNIFS